MAWLSVELGRLFLGEDLVEDPEDRQRSVTLEQVLEVAGERVFGVLMVLLSLPSALPLPAPGFAVPFGVMILLLSTQLVIGSKTPWLPPRMLRRELNSPVMRPLWRQGLNGLKLLEAVARPRWTSICASVPGRVILGMLISLMAVSMCIPIPGTNTLPALGICVTSFGLIEDDGLICLLGLGLCVLGGVMSVSILLALLYGGSSLVDWIRQQI